MSPIHSTTPDGHQHQQAYDQDGNPIPEQTREQQLDQLLRSACGLLNIACQAGAISSNWILAVKALCDDAKKALKP